ncbi:MAG: DMT family transporter [Melioribacteraceae bacterium]|nr:DMT family transporter [Melioribacteraceae bacterium]MCF8262931.1 DMT family transporter [Melioribacteraceae bacterium]MCF8431096.1 DMT family transporter [Melioribacteraceae bacterium]
MDNKKKSYLLAFFAVFFWATSATAFKLTLEGMNNVQLLFYSSISSTIALVFIGLLKRVKFFKTLFNPINLLIGFMNPFLYYLILFKAYSLLPAQEAQPLNFTWPIAISIFSIIFLGNKFSLKTYIGLILAFIGIVVISTRGNIFSFSFENGFGTLLAVSSSLIWASFWIINLKDKRGSNEKLIGSFFWGSVFIALYASLFDTILIENPIYILGGLYIGFFEMGITFYVWLRALELSADRAKVSTLAFLAPFISMLLIAFVLGEVIRVSSIVGFGFIVGGIGIQNIKFVRFRQV